MADLNVAPVNRTGWKCERCEFCGVVVHAKDADVSGVVALIEGSHAAQSPACKLDLAKVRVWEIPGDA